MSADRWSQCPRCNADWLRELSRIGAECDAAYGKVEPSEYERLRREVRAASNRSPDETFREDYEIGINGEFFEVDYHGKCEKCGLTHTFKRRDKIELPPAVDAVGRRGNQAV